jgi:hypothetical protein
MQIYHTDFYRNRSSSLCAVTNWWMDMNLNIYETHVKIYLKTRPRVPVSGDWAFWNWLRHSTLQPSTQSNNINVAGMMNYNITNIYTVLHRVIRVSQRNILNRIPNKIWQTDKCLACSDAPRSCNKRESALNTSVSPHNLFAKHKYLQLQTFCYEHVA